VEQAVGVDNIYDAVSINYVHQLNQALRAKELYKRDKDYLVDAGEVKIVDEFTGRTLDGRRWSEGLHQAVEAKERVSIKGEPHWATVTLQNYFRLYEKLGGMTGTPRPRPASSPAPTAFRWSRSRPTSHSTDSTSPTSSSSPKRRSSTPSPTTWRSGARRASRCSSAPPRSPSPSC